MPTGTKDSGLDDAFMSSLRHATWFAAVGSPLSEAETAEALSYAEGLGIEAGDVRPVADWSEAASYASDPAVDMSWWRREEDLYREIRGMIRKSGREEAANRALTETADLVGEAALTCALASLARNGIADGALARVGSGAVSMVCNHAAAAHFARLDGHPFLQKLGLFQAGRLVLGIDGGKIHVF